MKKKQPRRTGFALIAVLALVSVLVLLLAALMGTNRTAFGLLRYSQAKDRIDRTVSSVFSYCRFRLEHDRDWGKSFGGSVERWGHLKATEVASSGDVQRFEGTDTANQTKFTVEICNNTKDDGEVAILKDVKEGARRDSVPSGFCRFRIKVEGAGHLEGAEILVRNPGLIGAVSLANQDLEIEAQKLELFTKDPVKNQARAKHKTTIVGGDNFLVGQSFAINDSLLETSIGLGHANSENPVFWSGETATYNGQTRAAYKESHSDFKDQRFVDRAEALFETPNVKLTDLAEVKAANGTGKTTQDVPGGVYRFEQYGDPAVRVLTRRAVGSSGPAAVDGPVLEYWWTADAGSTADEEDVSDYVDAAASLGTRQTGTFVALNSQGGALADLTSRRVIFNDEHNYKVDGDFALKGFSTAGDSSARDVNPAIYFGDPNKLALTGDDLAAASTAAADVQGIDAGEVVTGEKGSLEATGRLYLQGEISGSTTLKAKGDVTLMPSRFFDPVGDDEGNFSVFSEGDVRILPPPIAEGFDDREVTSAGTVVGAVAGDGSIVAGNSVNISEKDLKFAGLIYAGGSVTIDLQDTGNQGGEKRNLFMEGAIVARDGNLTIRNADELRLIYNPLFVDQMLPGLAHSNRRRIEVVSWRDYKPSRL